MEWQTLVIEPARPRRQRPLWLDVALVLLGALIALVSCAPRPASNRLVHYPEADVLFTTPADVHRLCQRASNARRDGRYLGCYFPHQRLAIVPHGDPDVLAHELRHAREGQFHE